MGQLFYIGTRPIDRQPIVMFLHAEFKRSRTGVENSALRRAQAIEQKLGLRPQLLSINYDPHFEETRAVMIREGWASKGLRFRNLYDHFQEMDGEDASSATGGPPTHERWICEPVPGTPDMRVRDETGKLLMYRKHSRQTGVLQYINLFDNGAKWRRDTYTPHGVLSRIQYLDPATGEAIYEHYLRPDGSVAIIQRYAEQDGGRRLSRISLMNREGYCEHDFASQAERIAFWLDHLTADPRQSFLLVSDRNRFFYDPLRKLKTHPDKDHVRIVTVIHSVHTRDGFDIQHAPVKATYAAILNDIEAPDAIVVGTEKQRRDIAERFGGGNLHVIPHAYRAEGVARLPAFEQRHRTRVVCLGRYSAEKNQTMAIEAFQLVVREVPDATLHLYGYGIEKDRLQQQVVRLGLEDSVRINDFVADVSSVFATAGLSLLTSREEGFPLVILESLSLGCPAASFDVNYGPGDLIRDGETGCLSPFGDVSQMARRIIEVLQNPRQHERMCQAAWEASQAFSMQAVADRWGGLIQSVSQRTQRAAADEKAIVAGEQQAEPMVSAGPADEEFLESLWESLRAGSGIPGGESAVRRLFQETSFPKRCWGCAIVLYQPGSERLVVVRVGNESGFGNVRQAMNRVPKHDRFHSFDFADREHCRMQVDFILEEPQPINLWTCSDSVLPLAEGGETGRTPDASGEHAREATLGGEAWQVQFVSTLPQSPRTRFEVGVDGLRIVGEGRRRYFLPGDAFVRSVLGMRQLRRHVQRLFPGANIRTLEYSRFRSLSYVSTATGWTRLFRGYPIDDRLCDEASGDGKPYETGSLPREGPSRRSEVATLFRAAQAGVRWLVENQFEDGRFVYYYDAATDSCRDHEHPARDPETNPYYNLLRHAGAGLTLLFYEDYCRLAASQSSATVGNGNANLPIDGELRARVRPTIERACGFFIDQLVRYETSAGLPAAYPLFNRKAKLGGAGIGLYMLALYQKLFDDRYAEHSQLVASHIAGEVQASGEFMYYHVYLDELVTPEGNRELFSFYYPGEAVIGLANYCRYVCDSASERGLLRAKLHSALRFLTIDRPRLYREHYASLPSDGWLMMGINDLWDEEDFQKTLYSDFVLADADQMVAHQYTDENALYPDYEGSFYYRYGDHPYPDGARAEGLLGAYCLAQKIGDTERMTRFKQAIDRVAWATGRLCNTRDSAYAAANPARATGGIRFKLTRQWFRIDTIQHVASFYLKLLVASGGR